MPALINGVIHSWSSISIVVMGRTLVGVTGIKYGHKRSKENVWGAGDVPIARSYGNKEPEPVTLELMQFEIIMIQQAAAGMDITDIPPFDIIVSYAGRNGQGPVTDIIRNCEFTSNTRDWKQGDTKGTFGLELITSNIVYHSAP